VTDFFDNKTSKITICSEKNEREISMVAVYEVLKIPRDQVQICQIKQAPVDFAQLTTTERAVVLAAIEGDPSLERDDIYCETVKLLKAIHQADPAVRTQYILKRIAGD